jgi:hypothetical protein
MKKWFRKKLINLLKENPEFPSIPTEYVAKSKLDSDGLEIAVHAAIGGNVIQVRRYQINSNKLYIVSNGELLLA